MKIKIKKGISSLIILGLIASSNMTYAIELDESIDYQEENKEELEEKEDIKESDELESKEDNDEEIDEIKEKEPEEKDYKEIEEKNYKMEKIKVQFNKVNLVVDRERIMTDNILYEGTTYIPIRATAEMLNMNVDFNKDTRTVNITKSGEEDNSKSIKGSGVFSEKDIDVSFDSIKLLVEGKPVKGKNILYDGTTYVSIRNTAEALDMNVDWNGETNTATIGKLRPGFLDYKDNKLSKEIEVVDDRGSVKFSYTINKVYELDKIYNKYAAKGKKPKQVVVIEFDYKNLGLRSLSEKDILSLGHADYNDHEKYGTILSETGETGYLYNYINKNTKSDRVLKKGESGKSYLTIGFDQATEFIEVFTPNYIYEWKKSDYTVTELIPMTYFLPVSKIVEEDISE